jgi:hypothetical protein
LTPSANLGERTFYVLGAGQDHAAVSVRISAAVIGHPTVIGAVHRHFERHVVASGPGTEPARGQRQVCIDSLMIHILDAFAGIRVDQRRGLARPLHAGETRHIAAGCFVGFGPAETATISALPLGVGHMPGAIL